MVINTCNMRPHQLWWTERNDIFEETPCTYYTWPRDRLVSFVVNRSKYRQPDTCLVPTFSLREIGQTLDECVRDAIRAEAQSENIGIKEVHAHVIEIRDLPDHYGVLATRRKAEVQLDFWEGAETRVRAKFKRRKP